jgi:lipoprotein-releasing system ATP-binding protein
MNSPTAASSPSVVVRPAGAPRSHAFPGLRKVAPGPAEDGAHQLVARGLHKSFRKGKITIPVLRGVDFAVRRGQFTAVVGQSGSGKSTLLHLLATLDAPDKGEVHFEGRRIDDLPSVRRDRIRNRNLGMIFQFYHLLPELTTLENVLAPIMIHEGIWHYLLNKRAHVERARKLLDLVGLGHRLQHRPRELSGGEMQRAAIARALVAAPQLLLADEPTGNLDRRNGADILGILRTLNREENLTIVMVTHDQAIAERADCTVQLVEGQVQAT